jgi:cytochrome d ubiquinol oxidase subunit II
MLAIANIPREISRKKNFRAFLSSSAIIALLVLIFGLEMFPNLIVSNPAMENSLTIHNGASSEKTLTVMLVIAAIGMPLVLAYTSIIYWVFRGKVKVDSHSY